MDCIITIDLGTNAVQIVAFDHTGQTIGSMKGSYSTFHKEPDYSEQDPEQIFITVLYVLKNFLNEKIHPREYKIAAICFSAAMHSVLPVDKNGVPLGNAITWSDNRGKKIAKELKESKAGEAIYKATGTPIHPMSPLIKVSWLKRNDESRFKKTARFLSIKSYIIQQLTGESIIDYSLASATGLYNIHELDWDKGALAFAGITADKLPDVVSPFYTTRKLKKEYERSLGLPSKVKIIIGSSDGCMATLGAGIWEEGKATITIEQSGAVRLVGKKVLQDSKQRFFNYLLTENFYVSGGPTNNAGVIFEWFAKQFGDFKRDFDLENCIDQLIYEASRVPAGSDGLLFLPYLLGERAPIWNANARGVYFGLNIKHEKQHFIRATLEGIMYEIYSIGKTLQEHRPINSLSINGSFAAYPLCAQLIADIFNKPVNSKKNFNSTSWGSFLLSAKEIGIYKSLDEAAQTVNLPEVFLPHHSDHETYLRYFSIFERLSKKLFEEFEDIAGLQQKE